MQPHQLFYHARVGTPFHRISSVLEAEDNELRGYGVKIRVHLQEYILDVDRNHYRALDISIELGSVVTLREIMRKVISTIHPDNKAVSVPIYIFQSLYEFLVRSGVEKRAKHLTDTTISLPTHKIRRYPTTDSFEENDDNVTPMNRCNIPHDEVILNIHGSPANVSDAISFIFNKLCHHLWAKLPDYPHHYPFWFYAYTNRREEAEGEIVPIPPAAA